ncbi:MAG: hypothetical protein HY827_02205 [Actinobacteria bacterium]|nr:hypothetical protein [Actinomycetota bacterium]
MADNKNDVEKLKRQASDLVAELQARKLFIPAVALLVAIVAAMIVLPQSPAPPPPVQAAPAASTADKPINVKQVANLTLVSATPLTYVPQTFSEENPFSVSSDVNCRMTKSSKPREFECVIGATVAVFKCLESDDFAMCKDSGSSGSTGASGGGGGTGTSGGGDSPNKKKKSKSTYYVVDVDFDGDTKKSVEAGEELPSSGTPVVYYAGPNSSGSKAIFVLADGVSIQGADADPDLGTFEISAGDEVVLTTSDGVIHQMQLSKIRKVTK